MRSFIICTVTGQMKVGVRDVHVARTGDRNSDRGCVGKPAQTVIWNPEKLTVMLLVRSFDVCC
jgi:hypothetical protein